MTHYFTTIAFGAVAGVALLAVAAFIVSEHFDTRLIEF